MLLLWCKGCFNSRLEVIYVESGVSHLPSDNSLRGFVCWPIKHNNTMISKAAIGTFGIVGRCQVLLESKHQHLYKAHQQCEA